MELFPAKRKEAKLVTVSKPNKSNYNEIKNHRQISMLNGIGKLYEGIINNILENFLTQTNQVNEIQFGFRRGKNTIQAIKKVINHINTAKEDDKYVKLACLDNAWWTQILLQLKIKNTPRKLYKSIKSYFTNRKTSMTYTNRCFK